MVARAQERASPFQISRQPILYACRRRSGNLVGRTTSLSPKDALDAMTTRDRSHGPKRILLLKFDLLYGSGVGHRGFNHLSCDGAQSSGMIDGHVATL